MYMADMAERTGKTVTFVTATIQQPSQNLQKSTNLQINDD